MSKYTRRDFLRRAKTQIFSPTLMKNFWSTGSSRNDFPDEQEQMEGHLTVMSASLCLTNFNEEHKSILRNTWNLISQSKESLAMKVFQMIFEQSPEAKELFYFAKNDSMNKITANKEFKFHALRFMQVLETTIQNLDTPQAVDTVVNNLGHIHARLQEQRGFQPYFWSVFVECTIFHFRKHLQKVAECEDELDLSVVVWRILLRSLIKGMKKGFYAKVEMNAQCRKASVPASARLAAKDDKKPAPSSSQSSIEGYKEQQWTLSSFNNEDEEV